MYSDNALLYATAVYLIDYSFICHIFAVYQFDCVATLSGVTITMIFYTTLRIILILLYVNIAMETVGSGDF